MTNISERARPAGGAEGGYRPQLDAVRAVAVAMVIVGHWTGKSTFWFSGHVGVQLFFVISGFLITGILLDARRRAESQGIAARHVLGRFYIPRVLRIFPLFYATLFVTCFFFPEVRDSLWWHLCYASNVYFGLHGDFVGHMSHFWSLAVEEQFYLVWPLVILFAPRRWLLPLMLACMATAPIFRFIGRSVYHASDVAVLTLPFANLDTLGIGALFALLTRNEIASANAEAGVRKLATMLGGVGTLVFVACYLVGRFATSNVMVGVVGGVALPAAAIGIVYGAASGIGGPLGRMLEFKPLLYLGKISYGLYVLHMFLQPAVIAAALGLVGIRLWETFGYWGAQGISLAVLITVCSLSWYFYESKINSLNRFFPYVGDTTVRYAAPLTALVAQAENGP